MQSVKFQMIFFMFVTRVDLHVAIHGGFFPVTCVVLGGGEVHSCESDVPPEDEDSCMMAT
jgi:hypothetical protein